MNWRNDKPTIPNILTIVGVWNSNTISLNLVSLCTHLNRFSAMHAHIHPNAQCNMSVTSIIVLTIPWWWLLLAGYSTWYSAVWQLRWCLLIGRRNVVWDLRNLGIGLCPTLQVHTIHSAYMHIPMHLVDNVCIYADHNMLTVDNDQHKMWSSIE